MAGTALTFNKELGVEAHDTIVGVTNGQALEVVMDLWGTAQQAGEGNPIVEGMSGTIRELEQFWNGEFVPLANKILQNLMAYSEYSDFINNVVIGAAASHDDLGHVEDNNYDAAKDL